MKEFILDVNFTFKAEKEGYPKYLVDDLHSKTTAVGLVRGGTKYEDEVRRNLKLVKLFNEISKAGKVRRIDSIAVDAAETQLRDRVVEKVGSCPPECDDHHIFALARVSGCLDVVTNDSRMSECRDLIRNLVGHAYCPPIRIIQTEAIYRTRLT